MSHSYLSPAPLAWLVFATVIASVIRFSEPASKADLSEQLMSCYNKDWKLQPALLDNYLEASNSSIRARLHQTYRNARELNLQTSNLTIVTSLTIERLDALKAQCQSWNGPLTAATYLAVRQEPNSTELTNANKEEIEKVHQTLTKFVQELGTVGVCQLFLMLIYEVVGDDFMESLLPINLIRNAAMLPAQTPLVAMVDVDLIISKSLGKAMSDDTTALRLVEGCQEHKVYILPAFETVRTLPMAEGYQVAEDAAQSKKQLKTYLDKHKVQTFRRDVHPIGHACTRYSKWFNTTKSFRTEYSHVCEPWYVIGRNVCPPYDVRFRGYGWNKVAHAVLINSLDFALMVEPTGFIVHRPHPKSEASRLFAHGFQHKLEDDDEGRVFFKKVGWLKSNLMKQAHSGKYEPLADPMFKRCVERLSWWKSYEAKYT